MAKYILLGSETDMFLSQGVPGVTAHNFAANVVSVALGEIRFLNPDGSTTLFLGTGFTWDAVSGTVATGTITGMKHLMGTGLIDEVTNLSMDAATFWSRAFDSPSAPGEYSRFFAAETVFSGNDSLDASRLSGNAVRSVILNGYAGADSISGGGGNDQLIGGADADTILGKGGDDKINGDDSRDVLWGNDGKDHLYGGSGSNYLNGGTGNDILSGGDNVDRLVGGEGNDTIYGGASTDSLWSGAGNDKLIAGSGSDYLSAGPGNDVLHSGTGNDIVRGGSGVNTAVLDVISTEIKVTLTTVGFVIRSLDGIDTFTGIGSFAFDNGTFVWNIGQGKFERVTSISGKELLDGSAQRAEGSNNVDTIDLASGDKSIVYGLGGNDTISGAEKSDLVFGGAGNDTISGDYSPSAGQYSSSHDRLYGESGNDSISGGRGADRLSGGSGDDTLDGGSGNDVLTGSSDSDTFVFFWSDDPLSPQNWGNDIITDFRVGVDRISTAYQAISEVTPVETLELTTTGWLLKSDLGGSVLLRGVTTAGLTLDDILA